LSKDADLLAFQPVSAAIRYVVGDATQPAGEGNRVIVHICNDVGGWGKGFVVAISKRWPEPELKYRAWYEQRSENAFALGAAQFVQVEDSVWVANLIGQRGLRPKDGVPPIRYDAVRSGLSQVAAFALEHGASVHMPRIGCGLAGGTWNAMEPLVTEELVARGVDVTVYDFG